MVRSTTPAEHVRRDFANSLNDLVEHTIARANALRKITSVPYDPFLDGDTNQFTVEEMRGAGIKDPVYR